MGVCVLHLADFLDVISLAHEGGRNEVNTLYQHTHISVALFIITNHVCWSACVHHLLNTEDKISLVLLSDGWESNRSAREVDALGLTEHYSVVDPAHNVGAVDLLDGQREKSVVDCHSLARRQHFVKLGIGPPQTRS